ncbi:hypothetical protein Acr_20g0009860 [Actinidia rufa]|uniref:Uncharacterized protein n=1 Tax=Actinidia rufa TaxID=165716 RepID=A0A7J0GEP3_9ERIC|nr:hypothetical protein Acr_20g0009860 [Actinidia rufa]
MPSPSSTDADCLLAPKSHRMLDAQVWFWLQEKYQATWHWSQELSCRNLAKWWRISLRTANRRFFLGSSSETRPDLVGNALPTVNRRRGLWLCEICLETDLTRLDSTPMRVDLTSKGFLFAL